MEPGPGNSPVKNDFSGKCEVPKYTIFFRKCNKKKHIPFGRMPGLAGLRSSFEGTRPIVRANPPTEWGEAAKRRTDQQREQGSPYTSSNYNKLAKIVQEKSWQNALFLLLFGFLSCIIHKFAQNLLLLLCDKVFWISAFKTLLFFEKPNRGASSRTCE